MVGGDSNLFKGPCPSPKGDNSKIVKLCWKYLKTLSQLSDMAHGPPVLVSNGDTVQLKVWFISPLILSIGKKTKKHQKSKDMSSVFSVIDEDV